MRPDLDPVDRVRQWLEEARAVGEPLPDAMALATASPEGIPSVRMVILRGIGDGFVFFTDRESAKGMDLASNLVAAIALHWLRPEQRQVRVSGPVTPVTDEEADAYWRDRPPGRRVALAAAHQSRAVRDRAEVVAAADALRREYPDDARLPRPDRWGGYRLMPGLVELWEERADFIHYRVRYRQDGDGWAEEHLAP